MYEHIQKRKAGGKGDLFFPSPVKGGGGGGGGGGKKKVGGGGGRNRGSRLDDDVVGDSGLMEAGDEGVGAMSFA